MELVPYSAPVPLPENTSDDDKPVGGGERRSAGFQFRLDVASPPESVPRSLDSSLIPRVALSRWSSSSVESSDAAERGKLSECVYRSSEDCWLLEGLNGGMMDAKDAVMSDVVDAEEDDD